MAVPPSDDLAKMQQAEDLLRQGRFTAAERMLRSASTEQENSPERRYLRGIILQRAGRSEEAMDRLLPLAHGDGPLAAEAFFAVAELFYFGGHLERLAEWLDACPARCVEPRGQLFAARLVAERDPEQGERQLHALHAAQGSSHLARIAGFDAVSLRDRLGRHREAWELAASLHESDDFHFAKTRILDHVARQRELLAKPAWTWPRFERAERTAFVVGLPRTGTSLLNQMLDRHSQVHAIGEYDGLPEWIEAAIAKGAWPYRLKYLTETEVHELQASYLTDARRDVASDAMWTLDKTLLAWCWIPLVNAVLPNARCLHLVRDPRDTAVSLLLAYFPPGFYDWTARIDSLFEVIQAEQLLMPQVWQRCDLPARTIRYEELVTNPEQTARECLGLLGVPMEPQVLSPEANPRAISTLSYAQVRERIHDRSIGRWQNYEWLFDQRWHTLAEHAGHIS
jgi:tetratricopeptide (TPR) repeat protein